ncbi:MAG: hypothetical protein DCF17_13105 [Shackletoniella antarctica]|uniref:Secreted protein n=1 Tax=Shackletoniella antarctica TaxID=268115 RepID=A0A2W4W314_9CYAN|nr:MAG: hypothetical protein DCF17_13105 [Shackletoniella antarctica]
MIKYFLPAAAAALALASALPALAQATCYEDDAGNVVQLGSMCGSYEDRTTPVAPRPSQQQAPAASAVNPINGFVYDVAATPFPSYLFDGNPANDAAHQTGQKPYVDSAIFVYQSRFVKVFTEWPYTSDSGNHAEWSYVDCQTGWRALDDYPMVGSSREFFIPPARTASPAVYRSLCTTAGVQPRF